MPPPRRPQEPTEDEMRMAAGLPRTVLPDLSVFVTPGEDPIIGLDREQADTAMRLDAERRRAEAEGAYGLGDVEDMLAGSDESAAAAYSGARPYMPGAVGAPPSLDSLDTSVSPPPPRGAPATTTDAGGGLSGTGDEAAFLGESL